MSDQRIPLNLSLSISLEKMLFLKVAVWEVILVGLEIRDRNHCST